MGDFYCSECERAFSGRSNFNKHNKNVHKKTVTPTMYEEDVYTSRCLEGCKVSFRFVNDLRWHLQTAHNIDNEPVIKNFASYQEFSSWLKVEEEESDVRFEQCTGVKRSGNLQKVYFNCTRSGKEKHRKDQEEYKRQPKRQGSCKLNRSCTSQIIAEIESDTGSCTVKYFSNHYGHETELQHLRISKLKREAIASKLMAGVPSTHILQTLRNNTGPMLKRDHLLTRADINNIKRSYYLHLKKDANGSKADKFAKKVICVDNEFGHEINQNVANDISDTDKLKEDVINLAYNLIEKLREGDTEVDKLKFVQKNLQVALSVGFLPNYKEQSTEFVVVTKSALPTKNAENQSKVYSVKRRRKTTNKSDLAQKQNNIVYVANDHVYSQLYE